MAMRRIRLMNHRATVGRIFSIGTADDLVHGFEKHFTEKEIITHAGIMHPDGTIYAVERNGRHQHVIYLMEAYNRASPEEIKNQGFITNYGHYMTATHALQFARARGALLPNRDPQDFLTTEDVW